MDDCVDGLAEHRLTFTCGRSNELDAFPMGGPWRSHQERP